MGELFGGNIKPACRYCELAYPSGEAYICSKKGIVKEDFSCRSFRYDPLMRIPHRPPQRESFCPEDFTL